jgi:prepilin-type N-terminal cleavage/methylation domain-containing protein
MRVLTTGSKGFTIVELVIGIALSGIFAGAIAVMQANTSRLSERGRDVSVSNSYAENKIEALRSLGYLGASTGTQDVTSELPAELKSPRSGTLSITDESTGIKKAVLTITYNEQGSARTYSYTTYIGEIGVGQY